MRVALVAVLAVVAAGCSSSLTADNGSAFTGSWKCSNTDTLAYTQPPSSEDKTITSSTSLTITSTGDGSITAATYVDAGTSCGLTFTTSGSDAQLAGGQTCATADLTFSYVSGDAHVSGGTLTWTLRYSFTGSGATDAGTTEPFAGTGVQTATCSR